MVADLLLRAGDVFPDGIQIVLTRHFPEHRVDRKPAKADAPLADHGKMRREISVGPLHFPDISLRISFVPGEMHRGKVQLEGRRVPERSAHISFHDAHLDPLVKRTVSGQFAVKLRHRVQKAAFRLSVRRFPDRDNKIKIAFRGIVAAHRRGAVQVDPDQVFPEALFRLRLKAFRDRNFPEIPRALRILAGEAHFA